MKTLMGLLAFLVVCTGMFLFFVVMRYINYSRNYKPTRNTLRRQLLDAQTTIYNIQLLAFEHKYVFPGFADMVLDEIRDYQVKDMSYDL